MHLCLRGHCIAKDSKILRQCLDVLFILSNEWTDSVTAEQLGKAVVIISGRVLIAITKISRDLRRRLVDNLVDLRLFFCKGLLVRKELLLVILEFLAKAGHNLLEQLVLCSLPL